MDDGHLDKTGGLVGTGQINCIIWCGNPSDLRKIVQDGAYSIVTFGSLHFDIAVALLLLALVILAEVRDIAYIFSNWTKVALICWYVIRHNSRQRPYCIQRLFNIVLEEYKCKLMKPSVNQCSVLVLHTMLLLTHLQVRLRLTDPTKKVKVETVVKAAIISALRRSNGIQGKGGEFLPRSQKDGNNFIWDCSDKGAAHTHAHMSYSHKLT